MYTWHAKYTQYITVQLILTKHVYKCKGCARQIHTLIYGFLSLHPQDLCAEINRKVEKKRAQRRAQELWPYIYIYMFGIICP